MLITRYLAAAHSRARNCHSCTRIDGVFLFTLAAHHLLRYRRLLPKVLFKRFYNIMIWLFQFIPQRWLEALDGTFINLHWGKWLVQNNSCWYTIQHGLFFSFLEILLHPSKRMLSFPSAHHINHSGTQWEKNRNGITTSRKIWSVDIFYIAIRLFGRISKGPVSKYIVKLVHNLVW